MVEPAPPRGSRSAGNPVFPGAAPVLLDIDELDLLKDTVDTLIEHVEELKKEQIMARAKSE